MVIGLSATEPACEHLSDEYDQVMQDRCTITKIIQEHLRAELLCTLQILDPLLGGKAVSPDLTHLEEAGRLLVSHLFAQEQLEG